MQTDQQQIRAKDVEQFDDILRTFVNDTNKFENRFGTIRDEEKARSEDIDASESVELQT